MKKMESLKPDHSLDPVMDAWDAAHAEPKFTSNQGWLNVTAANPMAQNYSASALLLNNTKG